MDKEKSCTDSPKKEKLKQKVEGKFLPESALQNSSVGYQAEKHCQTIFLFLPAVLEVEMKGVVVLSATQSPLVICIHLHMNAQLIVLK